MAGTSEPPAVLAARPRHAWWRHGMPQTQTAYVAVAFAALIVVIWILAPVFMTPRNLLNISKNFSFIALMSLGETLVIISGGIDLSVGSVCALSAVVTMMLMRSLSATAAAEVPGVTIALAALRAVSPSAVSEGNHMCPPNNRSHRLCHLQMSLASGGGRARRRLRSAAPDRRPIEREVEPVPVSYRTSGSSFGSAALLMWRPIKDHPVPGSR
jgi:Branched-chain amino acid transport system / permease component